MNRFAFAITLALALIAGSRDTARADGGFGFSVGFSVGVSFSGSCRSGSCHSGNGHSSNNVPVPYYYAPSMAPAYSYGYGNDYYSPYSYYNGYGY